jgi:hypothetical protein
VIAVGVAAMLEHAKIPASNAVLIALSRDFTFVFLG